MDKRHPDPATEPFGGGDIIIRFSNHLPVEKDVTFQSGNAIANFIVPPGTADCEVKLIKADGPTIDILCEIHRPIDIDPSSSDSRHLGIAISEIYFPPLNQ